MRLRALVRRAAGHAAPLIICGPVAYDAQLGAFSLDGLPLRLTALNGECSLVSCYVRSMLSPVETFSSAVVMSRSLRSTRTRLKW